MIRAGFETPWGRLSDLDVAVAIAVSGFAIFLVAGGANTGHTHGGLLASLAVLTMTLPMAARRSLAPAAAVVMAAGAVVNGWGVGPLVRCGAALPAIFLVAFALGTRYSGALLAVGLAACTVDVVCQALTDPNLGAPVLVLMLPITAAFFGAGRLVRSRTAAALELRRRSAELVQQREATARMAVRADRTEVAATLDTVLEAQIDAITQAALRGRGLADQDPATARQTFARIEESGREVLQTMRQVVGTLKAEDLPSGPQPRLDQLEQLLASASSGDTRLKVEGPVRALPETLELSAYRVVEHLLSTLDDAPEAPVRVCVTFAHDALEIRVSGRPARTGDVRSALAAARQRLAIHGGSLTIDRTAELFMNVARIPLISGNV